jgi:hypothetical protein
VPISVSVILERAQTALRRGPRTSWHLYQQATKTAEAQNPAVIKEKPFRTSQLAPIAEIFQPIVHFAGRPSSQQLEQTAHNNAHLQLVRDNNATVMPPR